MMYTLTKEMVVFLATKINMDILNVCKSSYSMININILINALYIGFYTRHNFCWIKFYNQLQFDGMKFNAFRWIFLIHKIDRF